MDGELIITTERVDDFVLLLELMKQMELPTILDRHIPRHWLEQGISWGWVASIWLAHIVSQGDHRKLTVRDWVRQAHHTLEEVTGLDIRDTDFTDDRLGILLRHLSVPGCWQAVEQELGAHLVRVYDLDGEIVRVDATTVSGYHTGSEDGLMQFGHSKDNPALRQVKVMMGALDPLGLPLATDVVSGEKADDPLYIPVIDRVDATLQRKELLFVGDVKMSALGTRAHIHHVAHDYLTPLALTGETTQQMPKWIKAGVNDKSLTKVNAQESNTLIAEGHEFTRQCQAEVDEEGVTWVERVLVVRSLTYAATLKRGLHQRLSNAEAKLHTLTPPRGRGKRQITDEAQLKEDADAILEAHGVKGLLHYEYERQVERQTRFVGPGRSGPNRPQRTIERIRYQITSVTRNQKAIATLEQTFGWRAYVTNAAPERLSLPDAVLTYRQQYIAESDFGRLKGAPLSIAPMYVKRDDQIVGLTHLLTLAVRLLNLVEFVVRRELQAAQDELVGLYPQNPRKGTAKPTATRLLKAFDNITLTIIHLPDRLLCHLTPLSSLQERILELLGLSPEVYRALASEIPKTLSPLREW